MSVTLLEQLWSYGVLSALDYHFARSLDADHPVVLMQADTGERIVHFAELDANVTDVTKRALDE